MKKDILKSACCFLAFLPVAAVASTAIDSITLNGDDSLNTVTIGGTTLSGGSVATSITSNISGAFDSLTVGATAPAGSATVHPNIADSSLLTGTRGTVDDGVYRFDWGASGFTDNDSDFDFFVFEDVGNDNVTVNAVLGDGRLGASYSLTSWGDVSTAGVLENGLVDRTISGAAFHFTDLLDENGVELSNGDTILGIIIGEVDASDFYLVSGNVVVPEPGTFALLLGIAGLGLVVTRRRASL
jgi:hypothetical protein